MRLPDYKMVSGGNTRVNMSAGAAGQVGRAFASMGKDLQNAGMEVAGAFEEAEKQHNAGKMADWQLELDEAYSNYQQDMASNPNNALEWRDGFTKLMQGKRTELEKRDISKNLRDQQSDYLKGFEGKYGIQVSNKMHATVLTNASKSAELRIKDLHLRGKDAEKRQLLQESVNGGLLPSYVRQEYEMQWDREDQDAMIEDQYTDDADSWLKRVEEDPPQNLSKERLDAHIKKAKAVRSVNTMENVHDGKNMINEGNHFSNEGDLEKWMVDRKMDATTRRSMHDYFVNRNDDVLNKYYAQPAQQDALDSQIRAMLSKYTPDGQPDDTEYAKITSLADRVTNPRNKENLLRMIDAKRQGHEVRLKEDSDILNKRLDDRMKIDLDKHARSKPKEETRTLGEFLMDGWINGKSNLTPYFSEEEIEQIMEAEEKVDGKMQVTQNARLKMFKKLYRNDPSARGQTKFQKDMAYAIMHGTSSTPISRSFDQGAMDEWLEQKQEIEERYGKSRRDLMDGIEGRDTTKIEPSEMSKMVGSVALQNDPLTSWGSSLEPEPMRKTVTPEEAEFQGAYKVYAQANNLNPNPDNLDQYYDYRGAWKAGYLNPNKKGHLPSEFKKAGHPRTYMSPNKKDFSNRPQAGWTDTRDGSVVGGKSAESELDTEEVRGYNDLPIARPERDSDSLLPAKPKS